MLCGQGWRETEVLQVLCFATVMLSLRKPTLPRNVPRGTELYCAFSGAIQLEHVDYYVGEGDSIPLSSWPSLRHLTMHIRLVIPKFVCLTTNPRSFQAVIWDIRQLRARASFVEELEIVIHLEESFGGPPRPSSRSNLVFHNLRMALISSADDWSELRDILLNLQKSGSLKHLSFKVMPHKRTALRMRREPVQLHSVLRDAIQEVLCGLDLLTILDTQVML